MLLLCASPVCTGFGVEGPGANRAVDIRDVNVTDTHVKFY